MPYVPQTQRRELNILQKGKIIILLDSNTSYAEIARQTTLPMNTVRNFCVWYRMGGTYENLKRSGAPRETTESENCELSTVAPDNTHLKHIQLKE